MRRERQRSNREHASSDVASAQTGLVLRAQVIVALVRHWSAEEVADQKQFSAERAPARAERRCCEEQLHHVQPVQELGDVQSVVAELESQAVQQLDRNVQHQHQGQQQ